MEEVRKLLGILLLLTLALGGCGDDSGDDTGSDEGSSDVDAGMGDGDGDGDDSGDGDGDGDLAGDGDSGDGDGDDTGGDGDAPTETACDEGLQDNDGDGECSEACSDSVDCGSGTCADATGAILCLCDVGYAGEACDGCAAGHTGDDCGTCDDGYITSMLTEGACIEDPCASVECGNSGTCAVEEDVAKCECNQGFAGDACNVCADGYEGVACDSCATDYTQQDDGSCLPDVCVGADCGSGTCIFQAPDTALCQCDEGWDGDACDSCELGYLMDGEECVLELPVQTEALTYHIDMANPDLLKAETNEVLLLRSNTPGAGIKDAVPPSMDESPKVLFFNGLWALHFDGNDSLMVSDIDLGARGYTIFVAMAPSNEGGNQAALAAVSESNAGHHGMLLRSQGDGTEVRFLHRNPLGTSGGDDLTSGSVDARELLDPYQIVMAERRRDGDVFVQHLHLNDQESFSSTSDAGFGTMGLDLLIGAQDGAGSNPFEGSIGEIVIYNGEITEDEREEVKAYLSKKWVPTSFVIIGI